VARSGREQQQEREREREREERGERENDPLEITLQIHGDAKLRAARHV